MRRGLPRVEANAARFTLLPPPNARLCKAMLDRLTDQAHIIETGTQSYRFRRTLAKKGNKA
jgi:hypothetical protein